MESAVASLTPTPARNLAELAMRAARERAGSVGFIVPAEAGFRPVSYRQFGEDVEALAALLLREGVAPGQRVLLMMETRYEWIVSDLAILSTGALTVPVYPNLPTAQLAHPIADASPRTAIVSRSELLARLLRAPGSARLERIFLLDGEPPPEAAGRVRFLRTAWEGASPDAAEREILERRRGAIGPHETATILYTSGTSSTAKGVVLSHENILSNGRMVLASLPFRSSDRYLSILPLAHILERTVTYTMLAGGIAVAYARGIDSFARDAGLLRPTIVLGVPRLFEQIRLAMRETARARGPLATRLFLLAEAAALRRGRRGSVAAPPAVSLDALWDRLFFRPLRERLGDQVRLMVSGSAPLGTKEALFFRGAGFHLLEGYGLSEAGPVVSVNRPDAWKLGTVGPPLEGVEVRIAEDGEILVRSASVMKGYLNVEAETSEALRGGWLHTGDLGRLDAEGFLAITGRKKDLIVTSGGKNIVPNVIEEHLRSRPFIQEAVVFGDRRPYLVALVVVDRAALDAHLHAHGHGRARAPESGSESIVRSLIRKEIDRVNQEIAPHERIRSFDLLEEPPSIEAGTLTPTLKVRRALLEAEHADRIASLYDGRRR